MVENLPMKSVGWGIIGCGRIATVAIAPAIKWSTNGRLVAVASRDRHVAAAKAQELGAARGYAPYEAILGDPEIDAVYIGLPNGLHEEWAVRCAQAGKHVLCEKSLTLTLASARRMAAAFSQRGLRLIDAFMYRHHPQWSLVHSLLEEGAIGQVRVVRASFCSRCEDANDHRWSALGGGALWDLTCYGVNAARYVTRSEPVRVAALADARSASGVDASTQASMEFEGGVLASVTGSLHGKDAHSLVIHGDRGTIEVERPFLPGWDPPSVVLSRSWVGEERRYEVGGANQYLHQVEHFASLVLDPARPIWPAEDGVRNVAACEAIEKSWRSGAFVAVDAGGSP
jgi:xylose dehydrogenase (NAD/NADP)